MKAIHEYSFAKVTALGLVVTNQEPEWPELEAAFLDAPVRESGWQWGQGDMYILATGVYGEDASQLVMTNIVVRKRLQNYAWVCRKFFHPDLLDGPDDPRWPLRRRAGTSFSAHSAVAGLVGESDEATALAIRLLDEICIDPDMSVEDLEEAVREYRGRNDEGDEGEEVSFRTGSVIDRIETIHEKLESLVDDLPDDWNQEASLLQEAAARVADALHSARNREIGGEPTIAAANLEIVAPVGG